MLFLNFAEVSAKALTFERGGISDSPGIVEKGELNMELGFMTYERSLESSKNFNYDFGSTLFRYGLVQDRFEFRLLGSGLSVNANDLKYSRIAPGFKLAILEEKKHLPSLQLISTFNIPFQSTRGYDSNYSHSYKFLLNKTLSDKISFLLNTTLSFDSFDFNTGREFTAFSIPYVFNLGYAVNNKLSLLAEVFGSWSLSNELGSSLGLAYGATYLVNDDLAFDLTNYWGLNDVTSDFGLSFGLSYRF